MKNRIKVCGGTAERVLLNFCATLFVVRRYDGLIIMEFKISKNKNEFRISHFPTYIFNLITANWIGVTGFLVINCAGEGP